MQVKSAPIITNPKVEKISEEAKTIIANPKIRKMGNETHSSCCKAETITAKPQKPEEEYLTHGNRGEQAWAELCQAQAQLGYHAETTTKKDLHLKSWKLFELYETVTKQV